MTFVPPPEGLVCEADGLLVSGAGSFRFASPCLTTLNRLLRRRLLAKGAESALNSRASALRRLLVCSADGSFVSGAGKTNAASQRLFSLCARYIIPPMPPAPAGIGGSGSLILATTDSVVSKVAATLVAFCSALLVTFAGSRIPALTISP